MTPMKRSARALAWTLFGLLLVACAKPKQALHEPDPVLTQDPTPVATTVPTTLAKPANNTANSLVNRVAYWSCAMFFETEPITAGDTARGLVIAPFPVALQRLVLKANGTLLKDELTPLGVSAFEHKPTQTTIYRAEYYIASGLAGTCEHSLVVKPKPPPPVVVASEVDIVSLERVCSVRRYKEFKYYDLHYLQSTKTADRIIATLQYGNEVLASVKLKGVDMSKKRLKSLKLKLDAKKVAALDKKLSGKLKDQVAIFRICYDANTNGICDEKDKKNILQTGVFKVKLGAKSTATVVSYKGAGVWYGRWDSKKDKTAPCDKQISPLVLGLGGSPTATGIEDGVYFDILDNGTKVKTAWPAFERGNRAALLVLDRNGDGMITNGGELFGNRTELPNGSDAEDGYAALAPLDADRNGLIDENDPAFEQLRLWEDRNRNGFSEPSELTTLTEENVVALSVTGYDRDYIDEDGNAYPKWSYFWMLDGDTAVAHESVDIWFRYVEDGQ